METSLDRRPTQNLHSVLVLLFLEVTCYLLEHQDPRKFAVLFSFDRSSVAAGQLWRLFSFQFSQGGQNVTFFPRPLALFFTLLLLALLGSAIEEEIGTWNFLALFALSSLGTSAVAAWLNVGVLGSLFAPFTLLYVYASLRPDQRTYVVLSFLSLGWLVLGVFRGGRGNAATLGGVIASYAWFVLARFVHERREVVETPPRDVTAMRNGVRFAAIRKVLAASADAEIDRLIAQCDSERINGVNVCPPTDFKPLDNDGYCIHCEGFAECSARYLRLNRPTA